jgi:hypothetical protein
MTKSNASDKLPSVGQMAARANTAHRVALTSLAAGRRVYDDCSPSLSDLRGMATALRTLARWGCIEPAEPVSRVTERGFELLQRLQSRL